jgi:hypothetical protein
MMADYHVQHDKNRGDWSVDKAGGQRSSGNFNTQREAIARANELAAKSGGGEVNIHRADNNQIRDKNTIGRDDPYPPKG